ncbi:hypothetical protein JW851_03725 [Candidatus Woesearchaeota archaeon]|nr:hypothetical protein [Candidatus Woesearchaeota archaeon]
MRKTISISFILILLFLTACESEQLKIDSNYYDKTICLEKVKSFIASNIEYDANLLNFKKIKCEQISRVFQFEAEGITEGKEFYIRGEESWGRAGGEGYIEYCLKLNDEIISSQNDSCNDLKN